MSSGTLAGAQILIVEDEYYLADDARAILSDVGAQVIGPVPTAEEANALIDDGRRIDGALLDVNLRGELAFDLADRLRERCIPFAFVTGYDLATLPARFVKAPQLGKPVNPEQLVALFETIVSR